MSSKEPWRIGQTKVWSVPSIVVTMDGSTVDEINIAEAIKTKKTLTSIVMNAVKGTGMEQFYVLINGSELDQTKADSFQLDMVRTVEIFSEKPSVILGKMPEETVPKKTLAEKIDEGHTKLKTHIHDGIIGYHKITDKHKSAAAMIAHDAETKKRE